jgi:hypothetical protein
MTMSNQSLVVVAGGANATTSIRLVQAWDKDTLAPVKVAGPMYEDRLYHAAIALSATQMLLLGGESNVGTPASDPWKFRATSEVLDVSTGLVAIATPFAAPNVARSLPTVTRLPGGKVLVAGGVAKGGVSLADSMLYSP